MMTRGSREARRLALIAGLALGACTDGGVILPDTLRFGQLGSVRIELIAPLRLGQGSLQQILTWGSSGAWSLQESISYRGLVGDEVFKRNPGDPSRFAADYASFITQINDVEGLKLDIPELPQSLDEPCGPTRTRIVFTITDEARGEEHEWKRCAKGSFANLTPRDAGPDAAASRVAFAAVLARDRTLGDGFASDYAGSVPYGTLDRGDDTPTRLGTPVAFLDEDSWASFWGEHAGTTPPDVDFATEMVVVGVVGAREEAGDSVEVRRILQVDLGSIIEVYERVPGDFCSPVARAHVPFHIVVSPRTPLPLRFADVAVEFVPCGG